MYLAAIPFAGIESRVVVAWHVPSATHDIINMLAESGSIGAWLARTEAELVRSDEVLEEYKGGEPDVRTEMIATTVHSKICCIGPKAEENTRPPIGLPTMKKKIDNGK